MRIIVDARLILPHQTGIGRYLLGLAQGLSNNPGSNHYEYWVQDNLPSTHPIWLCQNASLSIQRLPVAHMSARQQLIIPLKVAHTPHDIFHYPHFDLPFATPGKTVVTIHDLKYITHPDYFPHYSKLKRFFMRTMMLFTVRRAQRVITVSNSTKNDIIDKLGIPSEKIRVTPLGVDKQFFTNPEPLEIVNFRQRFNLHDPFILFIGERRPHKNIIGTINAFKNFLSMSSQSYRLIIAGKTYSGYDEPERLVDTLGLKDRVMFLDSPPDKDILFLIKSAEVLLLLSYYEGFGLPLIEAMASGTPVIASDATSLPEVVNNAGIIVPVGDTIAASTAILQAVKGGEKRDKMITNGYKRARLFSWERCAQQTIDIYNEIHNS